MTAISIIIKTLNEEDNIGRAIKSALSAIEPHGGEVIVADSASTDRTVEIATTFPVTIVQIKNASERRCGVGPQLGFQYCHGGFVYILDGDMELNPEFVTKAKEFLDRNPSFAGVAGQLREMNVGSYEFEDRARRQEKFNTAHNREVKTLNGGGLYRRAAIDDVGYLSDRNLHSFEEFDLGARLRAKGWHLVRTGIHGADHYGHVLKTVPLLTYRIRSGYILGVGEVIRAAIKGHYLIDLIVNLKTVRVALAICIYWIVVGSISFLIWNYAWSFTILLAGGVLPVLVKSIQARSLSRGIFSVALWHVHAIGFVLGLARKRVAPTLPIDSRVLISLV